MASLGKRIPYSSYSSTSTNSDDEEESSDDKQDRHGTSGGDEDRSYGFNVPPLGEMGSGKKRPHTLSSEDSDGDPSPLVKAGTSFSFASMKPDPDHFPPPPKKSKTGGGSMYSSVAQRIMASMGYKVGEGLGKTGSGRAEPVEESIHKGRRGLGFILEGLEKEDVEWKEEPVYCDQDAMWLDPCPIPIPTIEDMCDWMSTGNRKETIEDETVFCNPRILEKILTSKSLFDRLSSKEFLDARQRSNPFETIKGAIFQNRAAMKMANIDSVFDFMFTEPKKDNGSPLVGPNDILYFADLCAGPGGFSEYVLWRKKWDAKGFGFTLKDPDSGSDFKLDQFLAAPCETFDPHYGAGGYDGNGDITDPENLEAFQDYVLEQTDGRGVHFVMADGGISVEGQENIQEILTKQLVLCQYLCGLSVLREGGHFVCKVFDMFTPFSVGLFYLLYRCFHQVCLFKPVTSRPANSERYVVCKHLLPESKIICDFMSVINFELIRCKKENPHLDVLQVVPAEEMQRQSVFTNYVTEFNDNFGMNQILHLKKLRDFVKNANLQDHRQADIKKYCLNCWKVPNEPRTTPTELIPRQVFGEVWKEVSDHMGTATDSLNGKTFTTLTKQNLGFLKNSVHSWKWTWACGKRYILVGLGRTNVLAWDVDEDRSLAFRSGLPKLRGIELPARTVIEVELLDELQGEGHGQRRLSAVYVIDVLAIYGQVCGNKPLKERYLLAEKLCKVINKPCRKGVVPVRVKPQYRVADLEKHLSMLKLKECKIRPRVRIPTISVTNDGRTFIAPDRIVFFKSIKDPWLLHLSRNSGKFYYYNGLTRESLFECPQTSVATYVNVLKSRRVWMWQQRNYAEICSQTQSSTAPQYDISNSDDLSRTFFCQIIKDYLKMR